jgi:hypothetical protein
MKKHLRVSFSLVMAVALILQFVPAVSAAPSVWDGSIASAYNAGTGTEFDPYQIASASQLARLAQEVNNGNEAGLYYMLTEHIDLGNLEWTPIGNAQNPFSGDFDGRFYKISNMLVSDHLGYVEPTEESQKLRDDLSVQTRLVKMRTAKMLQGNEVSQIQASSFSADTLTPFARTEDFYAAQQAFLEQELARVRSLADSKTANAPEQKTISPFNIAPFEMTYMPDLERQAVLEQEVAKAISLVENATPNLPRVRALRESSQNDYAGLFGYFASGKIVNIGVFASSVSGVQYTGGIVGYSAADTRIENCYNGGVVRGNSAGNYYLGGIVGFADGQIRNCYNTGEIFSDGPTRVGGIVGASSSVVSNCTNAGYVSVSVGGFVGGIEGGDSSLPGTIVACFNTGTITNPSGFTGGIVGLKSEGLVGISANTGMILGSSSGSGFQGGIAGNVGSILDCYNTGSVTGYCASGISAVVYGGVAYAYSTGMIAGSFSSAGITTLLSSGAYAMDCYYLTNSASYNVDIAIGDVFNVQAVSAASLRNPSWIQDNLPAIYVLDTGYINDGYPILSDINYYPYFPEPVSVGMKTGTFQYQSARDPESADRYQDYTARYYFDTEYFSQGASKYNPSLATMSLCLAISAFGSNVGGTEDYTYKYRNAEDLLKQIGFDEGSIAANQYFKEKPSEDSVGLIAANRTITVNNEDVTLVVLAARGGNYGAEWAGNFTMGDSGSHEGFGRAMAEAYRFLGEYIEDYKHFFQPKVKLWITGYSRSAATVNLLAGRLNDEGGIGGVPIDKENLYAYCFEPPMGALEHQVKPVKNYSNIHNIVNEDDPVPRVAMEDWEFARYGVDEDVIPTKTMTSDSTVFDRMLTYFKALDTKSVHESLVTVDGKEMHKLDTFQAKRIEFAFLLPSIIDDDTPMSEVLNQLASTVATTFGNRENYHQVLEQPVRLVATLLAGEGYEGDKWNKAMELYGQKIEDKMPTIIAAFFDGELLAVEAIYVDCLFESLSEAGLDLNAYPTLVPSIPIVLNTAIGILATSFFENSFIDALSAFYNHDKLILAHHPELCLAWLQSQDVNYGGTYTPYISAYRVVRVNCPVDVSVYNSAGTLVAQIVNDEPQKIAGSITAAAFNANGEKVVYLPADETYRLEIIATGDGELNYSVSEYSYDTQANAKIVNYYDIPITTGDRWEGIVPQFTGQDIEDTGDGSGSEYALSNAAGKLAPSAELTGEMAREAVYSVSVARDNLENGSVIGGGTFSKGSFAQMTAIPFENCEFVGWYENGALVSTDPVYRFRVERDVALTAEFTATVLEPVLYQLAIEAGPGGSISVGESGGYEEGTEVSLEATPDSEYRFVNWTSTEGVFIGNPESAATTLTMPAFDTVVTANFEYVGIEQEQSTIDVRYEVTSNWGNNYNVTCTIRNIGDTTIEDWAIGFDFADENTVTSIWSGAVVSHENRYLIVENGAWNANIAPGASASFGFSYTAPSSDIPSEFELCKKALKPVPEATAQFSLTNDWGTGFSGTITVSNNSGEAIQGWQLSFGYEGVITSAFEAQLLETASDRYTVQDANWNAMIPAGGSVTFQVQGVGAWYPEITDATVFTTVHSRP